MSNDGECFIIFGTNGAIAFVVYFGSKDLNEKQLAVLRKGVFVISVPFLLCKILLYFALKVFNDLVSFSASFRPLRAHCSENWPILLNNFIISLTCEERSILQVLLFKRKFANVVNFWHHWICKLMYNIFTVLHQFCDFQLIFNNADVDILCLLTPSQICIEILTSWRASNVIRKSVNFSNYVAILNHT